MADHEKTAALRAEWRKSRNGPSTPIGIRSLLHATDKYIDHLEKQLAAYHAEQKAHADEEAVAAKNREALKADLDERWAGIEKN